VIPARVLPALAVGGSAGLLLWRVAPDVKGKPLFEDEAIAGLVSARPLRELLGTVVVDRGGAPLHFVLAHLALWLHPDASSVRWLSVLAALGTVVVTYDLGRRLGGEVAGATAAVLTATSSMLAVYASFGRMYTLLAFAGALAADTFVRALDLRTGGAAAVAAAAAWLLPAVHPYGGLVAATEAAIALVLWRGRPLRPALPAICIGVACLPFAWADLHLAHRFGVGYGQGKLASPGHVWRSFFDAISGFTGGTGLGPAIVVVVGLVLLGLVLVARRSPPFVVLAVSMLLAVPVLLTILPVGRATGLRQVSPRHLIFALPVWAALAGTGAAWLLTRRPRAVTASCLAVAAAAAVAFPSTAVEDPRTDSALAVLGSGDPASAPGSSSALAAPVAWLRASVRSGDLLFPYSPVFLAALPETDRGVSLPRSQPGTLLRTLQRAPRPYGCVYVAIPGALDAGRLRAALPRVTVRTFSSWAVLRSCRPLRDPVAALQALRDVLAGAEPEAGSAHLRLVLRYSRRRVVVPALRRAEAAGQGRRETNDSRSRRVGHGSGRRSSA
jgi:Dolichyl-phosphate-mannose-protein mannosyltransferase